MKLSAYPIAQRAVELAAQLARPALGSTSEASGAASAVAGSSAPPTSSAASIDA